MALWRLSLGDVLQDCMTGQQFKQSLSRSWILRSVAWTSCKPSALLNLYLWGHQVWDVFKSRPRPCDCTSPVVAVDESRRHETTLKAEKGRGPSKPNHAATNLIKTKIHKNTLFFNWPIVYPLCSTPFFHGEIRAGFCAVRALSC